MCVCVCAAAVLQQFIIVIISIEMKLAIVWCRLARMKCLIEDINCNPRVCVYVALRNDKDVNRCVRNWSGEIDRDVLRAGDRIQRSILCKRCALRVCDTRFKSNESTACKWCHSHSFHYFYSLHISSPLKLSDFRQLIFYFGSLFANRFVFESNVFCIFIATLFGIAFLEAPALKTIAK